MKHIFFICLVLFITGSIFCQVPSVQWDNTIGGISADYFFSCEPTEDGGYILAGSSFSSISGDKTESNKGGSDLWILKIDSAGNILWQNTIGGTDYEDFGCYCGYDGIVIHELSSGGYILGTSSRSNISGDKTTNSYDGSLDFWIMQLDETGHILWQKIIGGAGNDLLFSIEKTPDGGYILGGSSNSPLSYDKSEFSWGGYDYWIVKIDSVGNILWDNTIGGDEDDYISCLTYTSDGGYILSGLSNSHISGDKAEDTYSSDFWILKLDGSGNILWQNTIAGNSLEYFYSCILEIPGGYLMAGSTFSDAGLDKTDSLIGVFDIWVINFDSFGNIVSENTIGGGNYEYMTSFIPSDDGNFLIGAYSNSGISGNKSEPSHGGLDYWIIKINSLGNIIWQKTIGGYSDDILRSIKQCNDHGYILGGYSNSPASFEKTEDNTSSYIYDCDYWILKLKPDTCFITTEVCNGLDDDCNGIIDDSFIYTIYYADADGDGFGDIDHTTTSCTGLPPAGYVFDSTDCNDLNNAIYPSATEICNGFDDNCNIMIDEDLIYYEYFIDYDEDGFGNADENIFVCYEIPPFGYLTDSTDCNDDIAVINPDATELCNSLDDNCNGSSDEGFTLYVYFFDSDDDGYGNDTLSIATCSDTAPAGYVTDNTDCNDSDAAVHTSIIYYADADGDLYGDPDVFDYFCEEQPVGYADNNMDCDDTNFYINPGSNEICNALDDNCNDLIDEDLPLQILYVDADNDNFGNNLLDTITCLFEIAGYVADSTDCDDANPAVYPGAPETLNNTDDNCNDLIDEGLTPVMDNDNTIVNALYPNPATTYFIIEGENNGALYDIAVYDVMGKIMLQKSNTQLNKIIYVSNFPQGLYQIIITQKNSIIYAGKLIVL